jgi:uncharacterized protein YjdB
MFRALRSNGRSRGSNHLRQGAVVLAVSLLASCGGGSSGDATGPTGSTAVLTSVSVALSSPTMQVGQSVVASATGVDQHGLSIGIGGPTWSTSAPAVATVSTLGVVTAVAPGQAMVIASVNGTVGQRSVTVVPVSIASMSITPSAATVAQGATVQLMATALDNSGHVLSGRTLEWSSSDPTRATVTPAGLVTAVSSGVVTISVKGEGINASAVVKVPGLPGSVASVTVSPATASVPAGSFAQLVATVQDDSGNVLTGHVVTWSASVVAGAPVATVSDSGLLTALSAGTVIVQATSEGFSGAATITVEDVIDTSIVVTFGTPAPNQIFGDTLVTIVGVTSAYPLTNVIVTVGPVRATLDATPAGARGTAILWTARFPITNIPPGVYKLVATATDSRGAHGVGFVQFQREVPKGQGIGSPPMK